MSNVQARRVIDRSRVAKLERTIALTLCENIGSARCLTVWMLLTYHEDEQYVQLKCDPSNYLNANAFEDDYLVTSILQKNGRLSLSVDRRQVAVDGFRAAEVRCKETNARLTYFNEGRIVPSPDVTRAVLNAQRAISEVLGPLTRSKLQFMESKMRFGPGATTSLSGTVTLGKKFSKRPITVTSRLLPFRAFCFPILWKEQVRDLHVRESSKVRVVPKNAKTDRTICIENDLNIFVQLGFGAGIRQQLLHYGLDLNTQVRNQVLSRRASVDDSLCTMDLSQASDLVARECVWTLLPYEWADLLHFARTDRYELDGEEFSFHKWSSMGNGYTFELESLIFYGILLGCCGELGLATDDVVAYGDDLVFPSAGLDLISRTLDFLGFRVNHEKTFGKGSFRESCGTDWFQGRNVRPIYLRSESNDFPTVCYTYANNLRRWAHRRNGGGSSDRRCLEAWKRCFNALPQASSHRIPDGFGDVGFISCREEVTPGRPRYGWEGSTFQYRRVNPRKKVVDVQGAYVSALHGRSPDFEQGREALRGQFQPATTGRGHVLTWPYLGPWL